MSKDTSQDQTIEAREDKRRILDRWKEKAMSHASAAAAGSGHRVNADLLTLRVSFIPN